jgi:hypothetical protein
MGNASCTNTDFVVTPRPGIEMHRAYAMKLNSQKIDWRKKSKGAEDSMVPAKRSLPAIERLVRK